MFEYLWIVYMVLSVVCISTTAIISKIGLAHAEHNVFNFLRTLFILITAWIIVFFVGSTPTIVNLSFETWIYITISGITTAFSWVFFYKALSMTELRKVVPVDSSNIIIAFFLGMVIFGTSPTLTSILSMVTIGFGIVMMIQKGSKDAKHKKESRMWIVFALLGATFTALTSIIGGVWVSEVEANLGAAVRVVVIMVIMILILLFTKSYRKIKEVDRKGWIIIAVAGVTTVLSWFFFNLALVDGIVDIVGISGEFSIVLTLLLAFIVLKEKLTKRAIIGVVQLVIGLLVMIL